MIDGRFDRIDRQATFLQDRPPHIVRPRAKISSCDHHCPPCPSLFAAKPLTGKAARAVAVEASANSRRVIPGVEVFSVAFIIWLLVSSNATGHPSIIAVLELQ